MANALTDAQNFNMGFVIPLSTEDIDGDHVSSKNHAGGYGWARTPFGPKIFQYIRNLSGSAYVQGALASSIGDTSGKTQITTSGAAGVNTTSMMTTSGLTADIHVGGFAYCLNSVAGTGVAPEGEETVVVANTATVVLVDLNLPFSATITSGDTVNLCGFFNSELSADGDLASVVLGVVVGKNGISNNNYGWVQKTGRCQNALLKASTALTQNDALVADAGRVGPAASSADAANLHVGSAPHVVNSDIASDKTTIVLTLGWGFTPGTLDTSA